MRESFHVTGFIRVMSRCASLSTVLSRCASLLIVMRRCASLLIMMMLLFALAVDCAQARQAELGRNAPGYPINQVSADDAGQAEDTVVVCLTLVGGTALLAGGVWLGRLRRLKP